MEDVLQISSTQTYRSSPQRPAYPDPRPPTMSAAPPPHQWCKVNHQPLVSRIETSLRDPGNSKQEMGVSENRWVFPPNHPCYLGFSIIFTIHFGVFPLFFGNTHMQESTQPRFERSWIFNLHPGKWTWNSNMEVWKMMFLFNGVTFGFQPLIFRGVMWTAGGGKKLILDLQFTSLHLKEATWKNLTGTSFPSENKGPVLIQKGHFASSKRFFTRLS